MSCIFPVVNAQKKAAFINPLVADSITRGGFFLKFNVIFFLKLTGILIFKT